MFTNEEKKELKCCTEDEQQEIFKAFIEGRLEYFNDMLIQNILNQNSAYRTIPPKREDSTPINSIPWEVIDRKWNWAAMDSDGCICLYDNKPRRLSENQAYAGTEDDYFYVQGYFKLNIAGAEWNTSLIKRTDHC